jgi:tetratricopeptide (TPR) repeat protein
MLGKHPEALKSSRQAARIRPEWAQAQINIGASSFALGQFKEAADAYKQAVKIDPYNAEAQYALGLSLNKLNKADEEILAYKRAVALKSDYAAAYERLGSAYFKAKRFADAFAAFEQYKILKSDARSYNYVGEALFELGRIEESVEAFKTAVGMNPDLGRSRYNLGRAFLKLNDQTAAVAQYEILKNANSDWADKLYVMIYP